MIIDKKVSRRDFFANVFMGASLIGGLGLLAAYCLRFLFPPAQAPQLRKVFVATKDQIPPGKSFFFVDLKGQKINIINTGDGFIALSTVCTHLGCKVRWKEKKQQFFCPCHEGYFDTQGKVLKGPPPAPLSSFKVEVIHQAVYIYVDEVAYGNV